VAAVSVNAEVAFQVGNEPVVVRSFARRAVCDSIAWEYELVWQVARMIADFHNDNAGIATEALESALKALQDSKVGPRRSRAVGKG